MSSIKKKYLATVKCQRQKPTVYLFLVYINLKKKILNKLYQKKVKYQITLIEFSTICCTLNLFFMHQN